MTVIMRLRRRGYGKTLLGAFIVAFYLFPVYWMVATSLKASGDIFAVPPNLVPAPPVLVSYVDVVINNPAVHRAILNSTIISVGAMALTLLLAAPAAYALARLRLRFTALIVLLLLISQLLPTINLAVPLFVIFSSVGLIDSYVALIVANTVFTLPFAIIVLRPFFLGVPGDIEDAAKVDGCTQLGAFWRVVLPVVMPGLITVGALAFLLTWGEFVFALTLITSEGMQPITVALNRFIGQYGTRWNDLMAVATTVALPIVLIFASLQRYIVAGLTAGATKE
jgi:multiple sugar transport system permease protein